MSFWETPAVQAGPYGRPARPGTFDRIVQGLGLVTGLVNTYQKYQANAQLQQQGQQKTAAGALDLATKAAGGGPVPLAGGLGEQLKAAFNWEPPKQTEEGVAQGLGQAMQSRADTTIVPGVTTRLGSPEDAANKLKYAKKLQEQGTPGDYKPLPVASKKVAIYSPTTGKMTTQDLGPGISQVIQGKGQPQNGIWDGENFIPTPGKPTVVKPDNWQEKADYKEGQIRSRPGKAGGGSGRTTDFSQGYQQELKRQGVTSDQYTMKDYRTDLWKAQQSTKPDPTGIITRTKDIGTDLLHPEKVTTKERVGSKTTPPPAGKDIVHTSDHDLTPEEAAALLKKMGK